MFQGDLNQGSFHERSFFIVFLFISLFHHFSFDSPFFLVLFHFFIFLLLLTSISLWGELNIFWNSIFLIFAFQHRAFNRLYFLKSISFFWPLNIGGDPWSGYWKRKYQAQKGWLWIIFLSVMGWWKMVISHFKYSYLDWRTIPCKRRNDLCFL